MEFKEWLENANQIQQVPIDQLLLVKDEIIAAVSNLSRGLPSVTPGPVEVNYHQSVQKYELTNGYHRLVEALMRGETSISVKDTGPAEWSVPTGDRLFIPDYDQEYYGLEEFIEYYELKRL